MTFKQWNAVIMLVGAAVISAYVLVEAMSGTMPGVAAVAARLGWAVLYVVIFNILAAIAVSIAVSIWRREEFKDERADERDRIVAGKAMRNGYFALSIGGLLTLLLFASGADPALGVYALFGAMMLGGVVDAASRLVYYRLG